MNTGTLLLRQRFLWPGFSRARIFVNGHFSRVLPPLKEVPIRLPEGVHILKIQFGRFERALEVAIKNGEVKRINIYLSTVFQLLQSGIIFFLLAIPCFLNYTVAGNPYYYVLFACMVMVLKLFFMIYTKAGSSKLISISY